jgi:hypothetical protein
MLSHCDAAVAATENKCCFAIEAATKFCYEAKIYHNVIIQLPLLFTVNKYPDNFKIIE